MGMCKRKRRECAAWGVFGNLDGCGVDRCVFEQEDGKQQIEIIKDGSRIEKLLSLAGSIDNVEWRIRGRIEDNTLVIEMKKGIFTKMVAIPYRVAREITQIDGNDEFLFMVVKGALYDLLMMPYEDI